MLRRQLYIVLIIASLLIPSGCGDLLMDINADNEWVVRSSGNIILHYRPARHRFVLPLTESAVETILENKNYYYNFIRDTLNIKFSDNILIYLYRYDEAFQKTDGRGRGVAIPGTLSYHWIYHGYPILHPDGREVYAGGAHEIVHVITHQALGGAGTIALSEGYAVALDGRSMNTEIYEGGRRYTTLIESMKEFYTNDSVLMPGYLIDNWEFTRSHYTNAGVFTMFLFETYGIETANRLFPVPRNRFRQNFLELTGTTFEAMEQQYLEYLDAVFGTENTD